MFASDLQFPVTTDAGEIAAFLKKPGRRVVFSTYQSSPRIVEAQADPAVPAFDVVFADEAHRCAGKVSSDYGTVLDGDQIRASKRLFMTATPRTFTARVRNKADDEGLEVASMDDQATFGPVIHRLSFNKAIEAELLTGYQVVVVLVDDARIHELIEDRYLVETDTGIENDAKTLAGYVGVAKAIRDYDLSRTITFHSRVNTAKAFAATLPEIIDWMPESQRPPGEIVTGHVSGEMATGQRNVRARPRNPQHDASSAAVEGQRRPPRQMVR
jgi:predicted helicase